jgi:acyl-CoA synthetase (AMP-forming)/AMP-acid ligase II
VDCRPLVALLAGYPDTPPGGRLSPFKVPEVVEFRETFPRTSVGKIQKHLF